MGQIMGGITVTTLMVLWAGPLVGILATRWPVRRIAIGSLVLFGFAFMALGLSSGSLVQYYLTFAAVAVLGAGTLPITWTRAVNNWFDASKGLALGIALMGTGIFGFFSKGLTAWLIAEFGWRGAFVGLGLLPLLVAAPVAFVLFRDTEGHTSPLRTVDEVGMTLRQALRDRRFWTMGFGFPGRLRRACRAGPEYGEHPQTGWPVARGRADPDPVDRPVRTDGAIRRWLARRSVLGTGSSPS